MCLSFLLKYCCPWHKCCLLCLAVSSEYSHCKYCDSFLTCLPKELHPTIGHNVNFQYLSVDGFGVNFLQKKQSIFKLKTCCISVTPGQSSIMISTVMLIVRMVTVSNVIDVICTNNFYSHTQLQ